MAKTLLSNARVEIGGVVLGNLVASVELNTQYETPETTGMGDSFRTYAIGFGSWSVAITGFHDYVDDGLNESMWSWKGTTQTIKIRKDSSTIASDNPEYVGAVLFTNVPLLNANVGAPSQLTLNLQGTGALSRATS